MTREKILGKFALKKFHSAQITCWKHYPDKLKLKRDSKIFHALEQVLFVHIIKLTSTNSNPIAMQTFKIFENLTISTF
jgi:hypothetical protein